MSKKTASSGIGGATILMVLLVLALVTFSVSSLTTAQAEQRLIDKSTAIVTQYYQADSIAEGYLQQIHQTTSQENWDQAIITTL